MESSDKVTLEVTVHFGGSDGRRIKPSCNMPRECVFNRIPDDLKIRRDEAILKIILDGIRNLDALSRL